VPVVAQGERWVWAQNLRDLAAFLGMSDRLPEPLSDTELIERYLAVQRAAQRHVAQLPEADLCERVIPQRDRTNRMLGVHIFRIAEGFLDTVDGTWTHDPLKLEYDDGEPGLSAQREILDYAQHVLDKLQAWQGHFKPEMAETMRPTTSGPQTVRWLLERSTLHSAQHARQLQFVVEKKGIAVDGPLTEKELGGLPLPERLFE
jgi:hypothetical protein